MNQSTFDTILGSVVLVLLTVGATAMWRQADANKKIAVTLAELNTGASAGARAAIEDLRRDLRNGVRDIVRDTEQLRTEHDNLAERHHSLNGTVVQLAERVNGTQQAVHEIRRDIYAVRPRDGHQQGSAT